MTRDLASEVAQLLIIRASGYNDDSLRRYPKWEATNAELKHLLKVGIGGVSLLGGTINELKNRGLYQHIWQAFAVLLPVNTVGVMGDARTYEFVCTTIPRHYAA